jgi:hypothetical protein
MIKINDKKKLAIIVPIIIAIIAAVGGLFNSIGSDIYQDIFHPAIEPTFEMTVTGYTNCSIGHDSELTLHYNYSKENGILHIEPHMAYLDLLSQEGPIKGINYQWTPFNCKWPEISIKSVNNKKETVYLTEVDVYVESSEVNLKPVLVIKDQSFDGVLIIANNGWGEVKNATINFSIRPSNSYEDLDPMKEDLDHDINLGTFLETEHINITRNVSSDIIGRNDYGYKEVSVIGKIVYQTENEEKHSLWFKTRVILDPINGGGGCPPEYKYDLFLKGGKSDFIEHLPISQSLSSGEVDHFLIRIASDKSSKFNLSLSFKDGSDNVIHNEKLYLDIFVPRENLN